MISRILKLLFIGLVVRPVVLVLLGLNIRGKTNLPLNDPAVIAPNHNSHLDTLVLLSLFPLSMVHKVRPVPAADYFMSNRFMAWFSQNIIGIIPLDRTGGKSLKDLFSGCFEALENGDVLIVFPEGSRGEPEKIKPLKRGIYYLLEDRKDIQIIPVIMYGLGKSLPRGEALLVPFNCDVIIGERVCVKSLSSQELIEELSKSYSHLMQYCVTRNDTNI